MEKRIEKTSQSQKILQTAFQCLSTRGYANVAKKEDIVSKDEISQIVREQIMQVLREQGIAKDGNVK